MSVRKNAVTPLNLHIAIVAVLVIVNLFFATRLLLAWHTVHTDNSEQIAQDQAQLRTLQLQTLPLARAAAEGRDLQRAGGRLL